ncbi:MAG: sugar transferase, partial [Synergistaceae bacterium]|nr:sugar transferase [Synergistaceae bacterium]
MAHRTSHIAHRTSHIAHRLTYYLFSPVQIVIDILLCQFCFLLIPVPLSFEERVFLTGTAVACLTFYKLYGFKNWTLWEETSSVLRAWLLTLLFDVLFLYTGKFSLPILRVIASVSLLVPLTLGARYFFRTILFRLELLRKSIIILGAGEAGKLFAAKIISSPFTIRKALCFLDDDLTKKNTEISGIPVLGTLADFVELQKGFNADEAVIAIPTASREELAAILKTVERHVKTVLYIPDMYMLTVSSASIGNLDGMPAISSSQGLLNPLNLAVKTVIDYIGASIALLIFSPFMIWAAWRIKREDGGPVFFVQERVGWKGKHFMTYKFRSMYTNADEITRKLFSDPEIFAAYKKGIKLKDDPRLTKIGAVLRKTSIDELPQLFNVFRGEMSLVGPRPLMQSDVDMVYGEEFTKKVYAAKPGLTGIWQVSGRSDLDADFRREINCY